MRLGLSPRLGDIHNSPAWSPVNVSGAVLWLRSDIGITQVAGPKVSAWSDQSPSGLSASQGADASQPAYVASDINGRPGVRGAAATRLDLAGMPTLTAATFFLVITPDTLNTAYLLSGGNGVFGIIQHFTGSSLEWFNGSGTDRLTFAASPAAGAHVLGVTQTNGGALTLYYDGVQAATKATAAANIVKIDTFFNVSGGTTNGFNGDLLEVIVLNRVLGATELASATQYLKTEYAIS